MSIADSRAVIPEFNAGDRLRKAREIAGFDKLQFAALIGVHRDSITRAEAADRPRFPIVAAYSLATGVDAEWLRSGKYTPRDLNPEPTGYGFVTPIGSRRVLALEASA